MLQSEHIVALHEAEQKRQVARAAEERLESLRNPFAPRNMLQWILDHGLRLVAIVLGMFLMNRIASFFSHRSIRLVSSGTSRGSKIERENRARTLVGVFQNAATVTIFITGFHNEIPTGALLLVSDEPMVPEGVKTAASDAKVTQQFLDKHLRIGIDSLKQLINRGLTVKHLRF